MHHPSSAVGLGKIDAEKNNATASVGKRDRVFRPFRGDPHPHTLYMNLICLGGLLPELAGQLVGSSPPFTPRSTCIECLHNLLTS